jgi:hypothetical protein
MCSSNRYCWTRIDPRPLPLRMLPVECSLSSACELEKRKKGSKTKQGCYVLCFLEAAQAHLDGALRFDFHQATGVTESFIWGALCCARAATSCSKLLMVELVTTITSQFGERAIGDSRLLYVYATFHRTLVSDRRGIPDTGSPDRRNNPRLLLLVLRIFPRTSPDPTF